MEFAVKPFHRPLFWSAVALTAATFPLIFMGGLVTTHGAGMAVPDWPNSYGYNMFLFPPSQWIGGIWYEHVHRLLGTVVGFIAIILVMQAWGPARNPSTRKKLLLSACGFAVISFAVFGAVLYAQKSGVITYDRAKQLNHYFVGFLSIALILFAAATARRRDERRWLRWLCVIALISVCIQGLLGGLRVTEVNLTLAMIHGCFAQAFFCVAATIALFASKWWTRARDQFSATQHDAPRLVALGSLCAIAIFAQLIVGATMRHNGAGLAIPDLPLAYGKLLPPTNQTELATVNQYRTWELHEKPVTLAQVWLHFGHRIGAIIVTIALIGLIAMAWLRSRSGSIHIAAGVVAALLLMQFTLGVLTVYWKKPADIASLHVACGALLLMSTVVLTTMAARLYSKAAAVVSLVPDSPLPRRGSIAAGVS